MKLAAAAWCEQNFGNAHLGDIRRTKRLVQVATGMTQHPQRTIPYQMQSSAATKATYRFLDNEAVSHEAVQSPHWQKSRRAAREASVILCIQDTTYLDLSGRQVEEVGVIGDGWGKGLVLHTTLGVIPDSGQVLGLLHQHVYRRQPTHTKGEASYKRVKRETEARFWSEAVKAIGEAPSPSRWVYVADRGGDVFSFYTICRRSNADILVRLAQDRRMIDGEGHDDHLLTHLRHLPALHTMQVNVTASDKSPRQATVHVTFAPVTVQPPVHPPAETAGAQWLYGIRVWEPHPPDTTEPLEWLLATSLPVNDVRQAQTYVEWYAQRPIIEEYHQCLKTGCQIEQRQLHHADRFERLVGILGIVAIYLLQLRGFARAASSQPAYTILNADETAVVALLLRTPPAQLTAQQAWLWIAQQGGYLNRKHDPPPGWKAIWRGWESLQSIVDGFRLAQRLPSQ
jgi:Transposase DNA-binding